MQTSSANFFCIYFNLYWWWAGRQGDRRMDINLIVPQFLKQTQIHFLWINPWGEARYIDLQCLLVCPNALFSLWEKAKWDYWLPLEGHKTLAVAPSIQEKSLKTFPICIMVNSPHSHWVGHWFSLTAFILADGKEPLSGRNHKRQDFRITKRKSKLSCMRHWNNLIPLYGKRSWKKPWRTDGKRKRKQKFR